MKKGNVETMYSFDSVKEGDTYAGVCVYSRIEQQVEHLREGIAPWMYKECFFHFKNAQYLPAAALLTFNKAVQGAVDKITSDSAGELKMAKSKVSLTGNSAFAVAYKKLALTLELGGDLRKLPTVSQCEEFNRETNKQLKAEKDLAAAENQIRLHCMGELQLDDPTVDFESEEGKELLEMAIAEYKQKQMDGDHLKSVADGDLEEKKQDEFDVMGAQLADELRNFYQFKIDNGYEPEDAKLSVEKEFRDKLNSIRSTIGKLKSKLKKSAQQAVA